MPLTIQLQNTINFALPFLRYQPVTIGTNNEPAITIANIVLQTILGQPFVWRWNRNTGSQPTIIGVQDYTFNVPTFGFLEKATVTDATGVVTELEVKDVLSAETSIFANCARPSFIATQNDDNAGNITFRVMPVPDDIYSVTIIYQRQAILMATLNSLWSPVPDYLSYIYSRGFLAMAYQMSDDPRFQVEHQRFVASLIAASEGLSEADKNIFMGNALANQAQAQYSTLRTQQAVQARGT